MEDSLKKRKLDETVNNQTPLFSSEEELKSLLDPLGKNQLIDLLAKLGCQYLQIAEEIKRVATSDPVHRKLFVRGLSWNTTSETLCAEFRVHGEIEEGAVIVDKATGKSRGYGFITYKHMESAQSALSAPTKMIDGRMAVCSLACEGLSNANATPDQANRKLYIGGLSPETTNEMLLNFFSRHGEIEEGSVAYDKETNKSRGFGFVTYKKVEAAKKAIDDPQKILGGRNITVKLADTNKNKLVQLPLPMPFASQPGQVHVSTPPVGYVYPQPGGTYPGNAYPVPQVQTPSYGHVAVKNDGIGGYPYYVAKQ